MKTRKTKMSKWTRSLSRLLIAVLAFVSIAGTASARILFQDDSFHDVVSEGILINSDDGGDEDVTLQLGNDGTDATMVFDDGTGDVTFATAGGDFSFSDDNLSGSGGLNFTGVINFSGASRFAMQQGTTNPSTCTEGDMFYNSTNNTLYVCTATDTWTSQASGSDDFESIYGNDADNTLTTTNGDFTVNTGTGDFIVTSNDWSVDASGAASFAGVTSTGTVNFSGSSAFRMREDPDPNTNAACTTIGELILDTTDNEIQVCTSTGAPGTWTAISASDADTLDGLDSLQFLRSDTSDSYTSGTLTFDAGTTVDINGEFDASGSTEFHMREVADEASATCTTVGEVVLDTTENRMYVCTSTGSPGTWTATSAADVNVDEMTWEVEYPDLVVYQDGTNNRGKLRALYDATNSEQYYRWSTRRNSDQDIDLRFRYELPADFTAAGNLTVDYRTATTLTTDNSVAITVRNDTDDTTCHADAAAASAVADTWGTITITNSEINTGCTGASALAAGDTIEVILKLLADKTNSGTADVGTMSFAYTN